MLKAVMKKKNLIFYVFFQEIVLRDNCGRENKKPDQTFYIIFVTIENLYSYFLKPLNSPLVSLL